MAVGARWGLSGDLLSTLHASSTIILSLPKENKASGEAMRSVKQTEKKRGAIGVSTLIGEVPAVCKAITLPKVNAAAKGEGWKTPCHLVFQPERMSNISFQESP